MPGGSTLELKRCAIDSNENVGRGWWWCSCKWAGLRERERRAPIYQQSSLALSWALLSHENKAKKKKNNPNSRGARKSALTCLFALRCFSGQQKLRSIALELCQPPADCVWAGKLPTLSTMPLRINTTFSSDPKKAFAPCATPIPKQRANRWQHCVRSFVLSFVIGGRYGLSCCNAVTKSKVSPHSVASVEITSQLI